jgi:hypothetical protein
MTGRTIVMRVGVEIDIAIDENRDGEGGGVEVPPIVSHHSFPGPMSLTAV